MSNVKVPAICLIVRDAKFPCLSRIEFLEFLMAAGATSKKEPGHQSCHQLSAQLWQRHNIICTVN